MIWTTREEYPKLALKGEKEGRCPGCSRETETFAGAFIPSHDPVGIYCIDCIDGETLERLDPRLDASAIKAVLLESERRWKQRMRREGE